MDEALPLGWGSPLDSTRAGGKERIGQITRQGDGCLRTLLVHGARAHLRVVDKKLVAKHARIAWAILAQGTEYRPAGPRIALA
jgi:transposase